MGSVKVLALDIDGTLTTSKKEISPATKAGLKEAMDKGHIVVLASGRPTPGLRRYEQELELQRYGGYLLAFNGARVTACRTGELVWQKVLPLDLLPGLYAFARDNRCGLATHSGDRVISAFEPDKYVRLEAGINGLPITQPEDFLGFVDFDICKCFMTEEPERAAVLVEKLHDRYGGQAGVYRSDPYFMEIVAKDVDKASSLGLLLASIGVGWEDVICCGDGYNDISMIRQAGVGVAMGNAQREVKEAADYITASNDEDGLLAVIDRFLA